MLGQMEEFKEIAHCGGQVSIHVETCEDGQRTVQFGVRSSRPTPSAWFAIYALPEGIPMATVALGGIGLQTDPPPTLTYFLVLIGSDSHGLYGHQCMKCNGYWRSKSAPSRWLLTCPYCGLRTETHEFLTPGQRRYVDACCKFFRDAINSLKDGEHIINMDAVTDSVEKDGVKPKFYYTEETQQNKFECPACGDYNDIRGRYGYCSNCGTHNGVFELEHDMRIIQERITEAENFEACVKDAVSSFDSFARQIVKQLAIRVPMTPTRQKEWQKKLFHNLKPCADSLREVFDIHIFKGMKEDDIQFACLMFFRRHVYEHNGGEADDKYIKESRDNSVRPKQMLHETTESAHKITRLITTMGRNIHDGFHQIFPPEETALKSKLNRSRSR